jgi:hypothetical protein
MDYGFDMTLTFAATCKGSCMAVGEEIIENWGIGVSVKISADGKRYCPRR